MPAVTVANPLALPRIPVTDPTTERARPVTSVTTSPRGFEGEGFPVRRAFAGVDVRTLDPFIHMDQMGEVEYAPGEPKGTPWHPHRGFETVTYIIDGEFVHHDSNGGGGTIANGDTQWMTAGQGILHIETPLVLAWSAADPPHLVAEGEKLKKRLCHSATHCPHTTVLRNRNSLASVFGLDGSGGSLAEPTLELVKEIEARGLP